MLDHHRTDAEGRYEQKFRTLENHQRDAATELDVAVRQMLEEAEDRGRADAYRDQLSFGPQFVIERLEVEVEFLRQIIRNLTSTP